MICPPLTIKSLQYQADSLQTELYYNSCGLLDEGMLEDRIRCLKTKCAVIPYTFAHIQVYQQRQLYICMYMRLYSIRVAFTLIIVSVLKGWANAQHNK